MSVKFSTAEFVNIWDFRPKNAKIAKISNLFAPQGRTPCPKRFLKFFAPTGAIHLTDMKEIWQWQDERE